MKIKNIRIQNFRSIQKAEFDCLDINIFVGQNNAGKTNLFEAIEWFYNPPRNADVNKLRYQQKVQNQMEVAVTFTGAQEGATKMKHEGNRTKILNVLEDNDEVTLIRNCGNPNKRQVIIEGTEKKPGTGFDSALNDFLPKFEYIHTKQYYDAVAKFTKTTPVGIMLSEVLETILEENEQYQEFQQKFRELFSDETSAIRQEFDQLGGKVQDYLARQFPDCTKVAFAVAAPQFQDLLKNFETELDDGVLTTAAEKGDGMQRALMLAIIQAYADYRRERSTATKSFLFFIDEAELHLHPTAQRNLKNVLLELSKQSDQVFINTHSSVFVVDDHPRQSIFKVEKPEHASEIELVEDSDKHYVVFELLGGSPADLLLPRNFLIVEGKSEVEFLKRITARLYPGKPKLQIIPANGDVEQAERTINAIEVAFSPLENSLYQEKAVILCDQPSPQKEAGVKDFLSRYQHLKENRFFTLPVTDLEAYYPEEWKREQKVNSQKKKSLAKRAGASIDKHQFETEMPIIFQALQRCWELAF